MVQTIRPERRESERRGSERRDRVEQTEVDGLLYRLGRLHRVLIDVRSQVRELQAYASDAQLDRTELAEPTSGNVRRRIENVDEALERLRDDFDLARDAIESAFDDTDATGADVIAIGDRTVATGR